MRANTKVYFPNLNGLRFIAAFLVILHHMEQMKWELGMKNYWDVSCIRLIGKLGVVLFFVLSGFLITYLLLVEEKETGTIAVRKFYFRRILRIWPLYYLLFALSFFVFPHFSFLNLGSYTNEIYNNEIFKIALFVFFLPNLALILFKPVSFAAHSWSIGVEEQFYIIWPVLMKKVKNKKRLLFSIICGYLFLKLIVFGIICKLFFWNSYTAVASYFLSNSCIDCMAIGGVFALCLFQNYHKIIRFLFSRYVQAGTILLLLLCMLFGVHIPYFHYEFYSVFFGIVILNAAANKKNIFVLETRILNYLGKISYGLYMFHPIVCFCVLKLLRMVGITNILIQILICVLCSALIAALSYRFFESYFIKKKRKFSNVLSGENAV